MNEIYGNVFVFLVILCFLGTALCAYLRTSLARYFLMQPIACTIGVVICDLLFVKGHFDILWRIGLFTSLVMLIPTLILGSLIVMWQHR